MRELLQTFMFTPSKVLQDRVARKVTAVTARLRGASGELSCLIFQMFLTHLLRVASVCGPAAAGIRYPIPSSSEDSSGVPQRRQMTEEQSPQVSGSVTSSAQFGQYSEPGPGSGAGF